MVLPSAIGLALNADALPPRLLYADGSYTPVPRRSSALDGWTAVAIVAAATDLLPVAAS